MLVRMLYSSTAVGPLTTAVTGTILQAAQAYNTENNITGVLCQGQGMYLQALEGDKGTLEALYERITADTRHKNVVLISTENITGRRYGKWSMAHVDMSEANAYELATATGEQLLAHIDWLIESGKVMTTPVV